MNPYLLFLCYAAHISAAAYGAVQDTAVVDSAFTFCVRCYGTGITACSDGGIAYDDVLDGGILNIAKQRLVPSACDGCQTTVYDAGKRFGFGSYLLTVVRIDGCT